MRNNLFYRGVYRGESYSINIKYVCVCVCVFVRVYARARAYVCDKNINFVMCDKRLE